MHFTIYRLSDGEIVRVGACSESEAENQAKTGEGMVRGTIGRFADQHVVEVEGVPQVVDK